jgi:hypothetical protein
MAATQNAVKRSPSVLQPTQLMKEKMKPGLCFHFFSPLSSVFNNVSKVVVW